MFICLGLEIKYIKGKNYNQTCVTQLRILFNGASVGFVFICIEKLKWIAYIFFVRFFSLKLVDRIIRKELLKKLFKRLKDFLHV